MRIVEETCGDVRILRLSGEFDAADVPEVARRLNAARSAGATRLFVNLRDVTFASIGALGYLLEARAKSRAGDLVLIAPSEAVRRVAHAVGLDRMLPSRDAESVAGGPVRMPQVA